MKIDVLTLFPDMFPGPLGESMVKRAQGQGLVSIKVHDLRTYTSDRHRRVDDIPYGGGPGMVLMADPVVRAVESLKDSEDTLLVLLSPQGQVFHQKLAQQLVPRSHMIFICGHYEGFDDRIRDILCPLEISIGDYVLTGGELAAMVMIDAVVRLIPGVVGDPESLVHESFTNDKLDFPQYTRPRVYRGKEVPAVLISGNHDQIKAWRTAESAKRTKERRPDIIKSLNKSLSQNNGLD